MNADPAGRLGRFLAALAEKHEDRDTVFALRLAQAGLDALQEPMPIPALAVIGPTQTGKSTVVNLIAGGDVVETSPLAAHTQQAFALAVNTEPEIAKGVTIGGQNAPPTAFQSDAPACLIWDTPDFDSNASETYRQQVASVCAVVDLVVVVLSKEKYADRSVWRVLETVAPLGTPTIVCLNKCDDTDAGAGGQSDAALLLPVLRRRLAESAVTEAPVAALPRMTNGDPASRLNDPAVRSFRRLVFANLSRRSATDRRAGLARLVDGHWSDWMAPVERELDNHREWTAMVDEQSRALLERYRSEYIDHARHHDVAQKAILGLLELLEIPALAGPISRTRRVLTWPFRRLAGAFAGQGDRNGERDQELVVLEGAIGHCLLTLRGEALSRRDPWWRAAAAELAEREPSLRRAFREAVDEYRAGFQPRIDQLSRDLYAQLRSNPLTLNTLRAARMSADAGGIVLAIKTGALGLYDALFAPAVISLTSWLTESAVGQYLRTVIAGLKREQVEHVSAIVRNHVTEPLGAIRPRGAGLFGVRQAELDAAGQWKEALRR